MSERDCYQCGGRGHIARDCPKTANEDGQWGFDKVDGWKFLTGNPLKLSCLKTIATRSTQTKTVADAVEWTHTYSDYGVRKDCILVHDKPDIHGQVLVVNRYDEYVLTGTVELKPIKPTISEDAKRQLELYVQYRCDKYGNYNMKSDLSDYLSHHEII